MKKTIKQFVFNGRTLEEIEKDNNDKKRQISIEVINLTNCPNLETIDLDNQKILNYMAKDTVNNDKKRQISIEVVNLTNCPNLETIDLDNQKILNYMAKDTVKDAASFLEPRAKAAKQAKQKDGIELYYLMKDIRTTVINPDVSDLIRSYNLPKNFDRDLLKKLSHSVIVEGTLMVFDKQSGQKVISKDIRQLVILTPRKPTIEKPHSYEVDSIVGLNIFWRIFSGKD